LGEAENVVNEEEHILWKTKMAANQQMIFNAD
jgi:hypothetical protein